MSIAIDLTEPAGDLSHLTHPVTVTRPQRRAFVVDESVTDRSHQSSATGSEAIGSESETEMLTIQMFGTIVMLIACIATFAGCAWLLFSWAGSAIDQLSLLSLNQILQGIAGR